MATFRATFGQAETHNRPPGSTNPVMQGETMLGMDELTTSGTAGLVQDGSADFQAAHDGYMTAVCDGAVWIAVGTAPTAAVATGIYVPANERVDIAMRAGSKMSVIDDS